MICWCCNYCDQWPTVARSVGKQVLTWCYQNSGSSLFQPFHNKALNVRETKVELMAWFFLSVYSVSVWWYSVGYLESSFRHLIMDDMCKLGCQTFCLKCSEAFPLASLLVLHPFISHCCWVSWSGWHVAVFLLLKVYGFPIVAECPIECALCLFDCSKITIGGRWRNAEICWEQVWKPTQS